MGAGMDWEGRYANQDIPWDKGNPAPILRWVLEEERVRLVDPQHALVPGCGRGHDAHLLSEQGIMTTGFDLSESALQQASRLYDHPNVSWQQGDLFSDLSGDTFDLVWEHTCYCAILPEQRNAYVRSMSHTLKEEGRLLGIFYLDPDVPPEEGPPFGTTVRELHEIFEPAFELEWSATPQRSYPGREGRERLMLWKKA